MAKPNSSTTILRRRLVKLIQPQPPVGHGWCIDCTLFDGWTLVLEEDDVMGHLENHKFVYGNDHVNLITCMAKSPSEEGSQ